MGHPDTSPPVANPRCAPQALGAVLRVGESRREPARAGVAVDLVMLPLVVEVVVLA